MGTRWLGSWSIHLQREPDQSWFGTFEGEFANRPVGGSAHAELHPPATRFRPAVASGEHPRLLFRAEDVPQLKQKLASEFGQEAVQRMTNAPGLAVRHALTGDPTLAQEAWAATKIILDDASSGSKHVAHRVWGWRLIAVSIAYDCCYHSWSDAQKAETTTWMRQVIDRILHQHQAWTEYTGWSLGHRFGTNFVGAAAVGSLVLLGDSADAPQPPTPYLNGHNPRIALPPSQAIPQSGPIEDFAPGKVPQKWHWVGGLFPQEDEDVLAQLGNADHVRSQSIVRCRLAVKNISRHAYRQKPFDMAA